MAASFHIDLPGTEEAGQLGCDLWTAVVRQAQQGRDPSSPHDCETVTMAMALCAGLLLGTIDRKGDPVLSGDAREVIETAARNYREAAREAGA